MSDQTLIKLRLEALHLGREIAGAGASWEEALLALKQFTEEFLAHLEQVRREEEESAPSEIPVED
jgi:hypothetical protein